VQTAGSGVLDFDAAVRYESLSRTPLAQHVAAPELPIQVHYTAILENIEPRAGLLRHPPCPCRRALPAKLLIQQFPQASRFLQYSPFNSGLKGSSYVFNPCRSTSSRWFSLR